MAGASSSGALTPRDKSQHRAGSIGPAERAHSHTSLRCQPGTPVAPVSPGPPLRQVACDPRCQLGRAAQVVQCPPCGPTGAA